MEIKYHKYLLQYNSTVDKASSSVVLVPFRQLAVISETLN